MDEKDRLELRPVEFELDCNVHAEGSCLTSMGKTTVLCTATVEQRVPQFLEGTGQGWVTAEYGMLPRSTHSRQQRERSRSGANSRALEISRMIGRALRIAVDLQSLAERTVVLDCDVIQADGGTRCCAVNGAVLALYKALDRLFAQGELARNPMTGLVAAVSVGLVDGNLVLDLDYEADSRAGVDLNVVMTASGEMVEIQGTAENKPFSEKELNDMLGLARSGIEQLITIQKKVLGIE